MVEYNLEKYAVHLSKCVCERTCVCVFKGESNRETWKTFSMQLHLRINLTFWVNVDL